jgi:hypothetical protein
LFVSDVMSSAGTIAARSRGALLACFAIGCGPSPALPPPTPVRVVRVPAETVVQVCPCDHDDDEVDDDDAPPPPRTPLEYVRIDEWQPPPSVQELEARVMPRGNKPPTYLRLPRLTMHREITNATAYRRGYYWH